MLNYDNVYEKVKEWLDETIFENNNAGYENYEKELDYYAKDITSNIINDWYRGIDDDEFKVWFEEEVINSYVNEFKDRSDDTAAYNISECLYDFIKKICNTY